EDNWKFENVGEKLGAGSDTDSVTWGEVSCQISESFEVAAFDAYAYDVANLVGTRVKYHLTDDAALLGYYRHESSVGEYDDISEYDADAFGLSVQQKIGKTTLESGYFGVKGGTLRFEEVSTGINHALGSSLMIYPAMFNEGADTAYLKAVTKCGKTVFYTLYNHTWHNHDKTDFNGQELDVVVKHPLTKNLTVAFKGGAAHRDGKRGRSDTTASDARLFVTYTF
ncbi:hypothetical protein ACFLQY_05960, partial [Verrucomicrobiota bacterium]